MASKARRPIPTHPPYSLMIRQAIRSLGDPKGLTESSISTYIRANFDGLPRGHDRLLPYYLNKLVDEGEFMRGNDGRYLIAHDNNVAVVAAAGDDEDVDMQVDQPSDANIVSDEQLVDPARFSCKLVREMQWEDPATSVAGGKVVKEIVAVAKRRGRPPKSKADVVDEQLVDPAMLVISGKLVEEMQLDDPATLVEEIAAAPKKRGRPPKSGKLVEEMHLQRASL